MLTVNLILLKAMMPTLMEVLILHQAVQMQTVMD